MDVRWLVPCEKLWSPEVNRKMSELRVGASGMAKTAPMDVSLMEHGKRMPWTVQFIKKTATVTKGAASATLFKYLACSRPKPPTTRPSQEACCVTKEVAGMPENADAAFQAFVDVELKNF